MVISTESSEVPEIDVSNINIVNGDFHLRRHHCRRFNFREGNHDETALKDYLLQKPKPDLMIKIIGNNYQGARETFRSAVDEAFKEGVRTIVERTNVWLWNGDTSMFDLSTEFSSKNRMPAEQTDELLCQTYRKSEILCYSTRCSDIVDRVFLSIRRYIKFQEVPFVLLLIQGNELSVPTVVTNIAENHPIIIVKGTGPVADQLALIADQSLNEWKKKIQHFNESIHLNENDYRQIRCLFDVKWPLLLVVQPGRDRLDENILQIVSNMRIINNWPKPHIEQFDLAMKLNRLDYVQLHVINHDTIIYWTNQELDQCLELAIQCNAVPFVECLLEYGASIQRLSRISNSTAFRFHSESQEPLMVTEILRSLPVLKTPDSQKRMQTYIQQLFQWAVEYQHFDLIMSICTRLEDSMIAILLVYQWCRFKEETDYKTAAIYRKHRQDFDKHAAAIIDLMYEDDEEDTLEWLHQKSRLYQDQQADQLIDDLAPKHLLATKCMQAHMIQRWYGEKFHPNKSLTWGFLISLVCLCPLLLFIPMVNRRIFQINHAEESDASKISCYKTIRNLFQRFKWFYQRNVAIRFRYNMVSYTGFLVIFSYMILFDYYPLNINNEKRSNIDRLPIPITEIVVHLFLASIALEELRQIYLHVKSIFIKSSYWPELYDKKLRANTIWSFYQSDSWNVLDFIAFTLWIVGFITRFIVKADVFVVSKICMSLDLCFWYMRCLHVFLASEQLGTKLLMIFHTMRDLVLFLFFILIFLCAYSITTYSLISTSSSVIWLNDTHFFTVQDGGNLTNLEIFRNIIEWGTWKIFGSTSLTTSDALEIKYTAQTDAYGFATLLLTIIFLIIAYVLLLNNLIALFNFTIQRVHGDSHRAWCNHFFVVLKEYEEKDFFFPPFNLLLLPISYLIRRKMKKSLQNNSSKVKSREQWNKIRQRHQQITERYWKSLKQKDREMTQQTFICRQCRSYQTKFDESESESF